MLSIRYKALFPMVLLAALLAGLIATAAWALGQVLAINGALAGRYHEIEEVRQIEIDAGSLAFPHVAFLRSGDKQHQRAAEELNHRIRERVDELREMSVVNDEEREVLDFIDTKVGEIHDLSHRYFTTTNHGELMKALDELASVHLVELHTALHDWHADEARQVDELAATAAAAAAKFKSVAQGAILAAIVLFGVALWLNNRLLVRPLLEISKSTGGIADGQLEQHLAVTSNDEFGKLSNDINRMAQSLQTMYKRMDQLAHTDALTGLMNRRAFEQILERELDASRRYARTFGLVMLDVDHFKGINDKYGHAVGDEILKFVARTCTITLRASDTAFRIGGEEFVLLLQETSGDQVMAIAERCRHFLADSPWADADHTIPVTASFGVACAPRDGATMETLMKTADGALYKAKKNGRNRVEGECCSVSSAAS
jgi:diguanylate cyclase (GGDEF)-like protein